MGQNERVPERGRSASSVTAAHAGAPDVCRVTSPPRPCDRPWRSALADAEAAARGSARRSPQEAWHRRTQRPGRSTVRPEEDYSGPARAAPARLPRRARPGDRPARPRVPPAGARWTRRGGRRRRPSAGRRGRARGRRASCEPPRVTAGMGGRPARGGPARRPRRRPLGRRAECRRGRRRAAHADTPPARWPRGGGRRPEVGLQPGRVGIEVSLAVVWELA